jgi:predicted phosphodiesterase
MRVAVLSDIHANLTALDAVLEATGEVDAVWHLGDVVGYGPDPDAVVQRLAAIGAHGVRGNHDAAAVGELDVTDFNTDARRAVEWTSGTITATTADWLRALEPTRIEGELTLVHGSPRDPIWEYILGRESIAANLDALTTPYGLHGHTHVPIAYARTKGSLGRGGVGVVEPGDGDTLELPDGPALLNPGSVGQARDGIPTASWMVLDTDARTVTWHRVAYAIAEVQDRMRERGLPPRLIERLAYGW